MDPLKKLQAEKALRESRQEFARMLSSGVTGVANADGQMLANGDVVYFVTPVPQKYVVADVTPVLDKPTVGTLYVTLISLVQVEVHSGRNVMSFLPTTLKGEPISREIVEALKAQGRTVGRRVDLQRPATAEELAARNGAVSASAGDSGTDADATPGLGRLTFPPPSSTEGDEEP